MGLERDDWRLTAYALGELNEADAAAVEDLLRRDASAREAVEEIRQAAAALSDGLQVLGDNRLTEAQRRAVLSGGPGGAPRVGAAKRPASRRWLVPLAVAAGVLLAVAAGWIVLAVRDGRIAAPPGVADEEDGQADKPRTPKPGMENTPGHRTPYNATPRHDRPTPPPAPGNGQTPRTIPGLAPGDRNLAFGRPVTSSCEPFSGILEWITDADIEPHGGSVVELAKPGLQWVQIDLGAVCEIRAVLVWHFYRSRRAYHDVVVQVSPDAAFGEDVHTLFNNDRDHSASLGIGRDREYVESPEGLTILARGVRGRYVRLYSSGNTFNDRNHYVEVEVYGRKADAARAGRGGKKR